MGFFAVWSKLANLNKYSHPLCTLASLNIGRGRKNILQSCLLKNIPNFSVYIVVKSYSILKFLSKHIQKLVPLWLKKALWNYEKGCWFLQYRGEGEEQSRDKKYFNLGRVNILQGWLISQWWFWSVQWKFFITG